MGITVIKNRHGYLRFRIFWKGIEMLPYRRDFAPTAPPWPQRQARRREGDSDRREIARRIRTSPRAARRTRRLSAATDAGTRLLRSKARTVRRLLSRSGLREGFHRWFASLLRRRHRMCFEAIILPDLGSDAFARTLPRARLEAFRGKLLEQKTRRGNQTNHQSCCATS